MAPATPQVGPCPSLGDWTWSGRAGKVRVADAPVPCFNALNPFGLDGPFPGLVLTAFPAAGLAEKAVRVASAIWRRKCGLIIDPRLLSSNATSDPEGLKRKCRGADFCGRVSPPTRPGSSLSSCAAAICHKEQVFAVLCSVYSFGEPSHKSCPAINDKNHWYA